MGGGGGGQECHSGLERTFSLSVKYVPRSRLSDAVPGLEPAPAGKCFGERKQNVPAALWTYWPAPPRQLKCPEAPSEPKTSFCSLGR